MEEFKTIKINKSDWIELKKLSVDREETMKSIIHKLLAGKLKIVKI